MTLEIQVLDGIDTKIGGLKWLMRFQLSPLINGSPTPLLHKQMIENPVDAHTCLRSTMFLAMALSFKNILNL